MGWPEIFDWLRERHPKADIETDEAGIVTVRSLGDAAGEHSTLTTSAALLPTPDWTIMIVEGPDAIDYLHRRLSQSILTLADGEGAHALQLEGDGRMVGHMLLYRAGDVAFCLLERDNALAMHAITEKFTLMDQVNVHRQWEAEGVLALAGPRADAVVSDLCGDASAHPFRMINPARIDGHACRVFRDGRFKTPCWRVSAAYDALLPIARALAEACGGIAGADAFEMLRISEGIPRFGAEATTSTIPLEVSLDHAISFDKGCYPGQEIIARIRNLGHPARQLVLLELVGDHPIPHGAAIRVGGADSGFVTSAAMVRGLGRAAALGCVKWKDRESARAQVLVGDRTFDASMRMV